MNFVPMREVVRFAIGGGWGSETEVDGSVLTRVIRGADFPEAAEQNLTNAPLRWEKESRVKTRALAAGDIVLEISGGTKDRPTGRTVLVTQKMVDESVSPLIPASFCRKVQISREIADPKFVYYWLQLMHKSGRAWKHQNQSTGIANFQFEQFLDNEFLWLPSLTTQQAIASILGSLDDKIAANNHILGIIDETIQSLWKRAVQVGATYTRLDEVIGINPRTPLPKGTLARKVEMKNLPEAGFSISEWAEHAVKGGSRYRNGDTLLARITPCFENGKCGFVDFLEADAVGAGSTEFIVLRPHPDIPPAAPYAVARSADFRAFAAQTMTGTSGRQRVQARDLEAYETLWPNGEQLSNFGSRTTPLLDFAGKLRDEAQTLAKTRDELLPLLMSGKISVREAGQEAAAAGAQIPSEENEV